MKRSKGPCHWEMSDYCSGLRWGPFSHLAAPHKNVNTALLWKAASGTGAAQMDHHTEFLGLCQEQREGCCSCLPHAPITAGTPQAGGAVGDRIICDPAMMARKRGFHCEHATDEGHTHNFTPGFGV